MQFYNSRNTTLNSNMTIFPPKPAPVTILEEITCIVQLLNPNENARVHNQLKRKQQALQTAVVQLLRANSHTWTKENTGALVIIKDSQETVKFIYHISLATGNQN